MTTPKVLASGLCLGLALLGCGVSPEAARDFHKAVVSTAETVGNDVPQRTRVLLALCGEQKVCAAGCEKELSQTSAESWDDLQRARVLRDCDSSFSGSPDEWIRKRVGNVAPKVRAKLSPEEVKTFDQALKTLNIE